MIVLIEGLPGSGKTTTAKHLETFLYQKNKNCNVFYEYSFDNPVGYTWSFENAVKSIRETTISDYPFDSWKGVGFHKDVILESRFLQNTSLFNMLNGGKFSENIVFPKKILKTLDKIHTKLILLHQTDPLLFLNNVIKNRKTTCPEWFPFVSELFYESYWGRTNEASMEESFINGMVEWSHRQINIFKTLNVDKLLIENPSSDWNASLNKVFSFIDN